MNGFALRIPKVLCMKSEEMRHRNYQLRGTAISACVDQIADIVTDGLMAEPKNWKTPFFSRYSKFLLMSDWKWSKNALVFSVLKNLNKYGR